MRAIQPGGDRYWQVVQFPVRYPRYVWEMHVSTRRLLCSASAVSRDFNSLLMPYRKLKILSMAISSETMMRRENLH